MFSSPILDLVIALSFTYFILSLIVSGVHEFVFSVLQSRRSAFLKESIRNLFFDSHWEKLVKELEKSPHLQSLVSKPGNFPSYIPARNFAMFMLDQFRQGNNLLDMENIKTELQKNVSNTPIEGEVKKMLLSLFERSEGQLSMLQSNIETYFDDAMERASGVYKRQVHKAMLLIALVLTIIVNADTLRITKILWGDKEKLSTIADDISKEVQSNPNGTFTLSTTTNSGDSTVVFEIRNNDTLVTDSNKVSHVINNSTAAVIHLQNDGLPLGWSKKEFERPFIMWYDIPLFTIEKCIGILITTMALALGAPFWFDLLNKFVNLRAAGKKPEEKK